MASLSKYKQLKGVDEIKPVLLRKFLDAEKTA